jgi:thiamine biosynthesis lipoprotein
MIKDVSPRPMRATLVLAILLAIACTPERPQGEAIEGEAAGSSFRVRLAERLPESARAEVRGIVAGELERMASKADLSELQQAEAGVEVPVSAETFELVREAVRVGHLTGGAFDITALPLARLWGFGTGRAVATGAPNEEQIDRARARVGFEHLLLDDDTMTITKRVESLEIGLSALAAAYALDRAASALEERGYRDYLIEAGGLIRSRGKDTAGEPWQAPVLKPSQKSVGVQRYVPLSGFSMATSGDYRGVDAVGGLAGDLPLHLVDPRTGRPLDHGLLSVTVLGETCVTVEALAAGLLVLGPEEGLRLAAAEDIAALFLVRTAGGGLEERASPAFTQLFF